MVCESNPEPSELPPSGPTSQHGCILCRFQIAQAHRLRSPFIDEATIDAVSRVLRSGWITTGPETAAFEDELAEFCGADRVVCGGSWTGLAGVVLDWFGVGPGDEVILPAYTYCATANVVLHRGATPVLVDLPDVPHKTDSTSRGQPWSLI